MIFELLCNKKTLPTWKSPRRPSGRLLKLGCLSFLLLRRKRPCLRALYHGTCHVCFRAAQRARPALPHFALLPEGEKKLNQNFYYIL